MLFLGRLFCGQTARSEWYHTSCGEISVSRPHSPSSERESIFQISDSESCLTLRVLLSHVSKYGFSTASLSPFWSIPRRAEPIATSEPIQTPLGSPPKKMLHFRGCSFHLTHREPVSCSGGETLQDPNSRFPSSSNFKCHSRPCFCHVL